MHLRLNYKYQSDSEVLRILNYQIGICRDYLCLGDPSRISDSFLNFILSFILSYLHYNHDYNTTKVKVCCVLLNHLT